MVEVYAIRVDEPIEEATYKQFLSYIAEEKRERIERFHFIEDAKRTLYGEMLVRYLACDRLKTTSRVLFIKYNEFGKPHLRGFPSFHFNISHSGDWVVCAISEKEVGIDIEKIESIDFDIAKRFFSDSEYKTLMMQPKRLRTSCFYDIWTLKESYVKYIGKGLSIPLNSFSISIEKQCITLSIGLITVFLSKINMDKNYKLSVCSTEKLIVKKVGIIQIKDIKEKLFYGD